MENLKLPPYQRLKNILKDGEVELTEKASDNLDELLGLKKEKKSGFLDKIKLFFNKIDSMIFSKPSRTNNNIPHKRLKKNKK